MKGRALRRCWIRGLAWSVLAVPLAAFESRADEPTRGPTSGPEGVAASAVRTLFRNESRPPRIPAADRVRFQSPDRAGGPASDLSLPPLPPGLAGSPTVPALVPAPAPAPAPQPVPVLERVVDDAVAPAGCTACGGFHSGMDGPAFHSGMGCADGSCIPGRKPCAAPVEERFTWVGRFCANLYNCICCPDPCYQPRWEPAAYASLFADYARPRTVTRIRYDNLQDMLRPDRNQYWMQQTPFRTGTFNGQNAKLSSAFARLQQVYLYQEAAGEKGSFFVEYPYRQVNFDHAPTQAGFGDLNFGVKSLLFDCEMLQVGFQFRTYTPTGNGSNNLGTGHFSLDPSILASLKLAPETFLQGQFGQWIPLGGDSNLAGGVFYTYTSLNQVLFYTSKNSPVIGTFEFDTWSFQNGGYTRTGWPANDDSLKVQKSGGGVSYFNLGPGLRWSICNKIDIGSAVTWSTTSLHWAQPWFRFEVRFLF